MLTPDDSVEYVFFFLFQMQLDPEVHSVLVEV